MTSLARHSYQYGFVRDLLRQFPATRRWNDRIAKDNSNHLLLKTFDRARVKYKCSRNYTDAIILLNNTRGCSEKVVYGNVCSLHVIVFLEINLTNDEMMVESVGILNDCDTDGKL